MISLISLHVGTNASLLLEVVWFSLRFWNGQRLGGELSLSFSKQVLPYYKVCRIRNFGAGCNCNVSFWWVFHFNIAKFAVHANGMASGMNMCTVYCSDAFGHYQQAIIPMQQLCIGIMCRLSQLCKVSGSREMRLYCCNSYYVEVANSSNCYHTYDVFWQQGRLSYSLTTLFGGMQRLCQEAEYNRKCVK